MLRLPLTLWRYLSADLWRLVILSTAVVVAVGCFALAVKPLADGQLGSVEMLKFMLLASVPMLQYALPFAGGFAATLVYHRFAQDNEGVAAYAGGVSHRSVLVPALICAVALSTLMGALIDQAMPRLLRNMERLVAGDLAKVVEAAVNRGESVKIPGTEYRVYADAFTTLDPGDSGADHHFGLSGLLFVEQAPGGEVKREASARFAYVWLFQDGRQREDAPRGTSTATVVMKLQDSVGGELTRAEVQESVLVYEMPSKTREHPRFLTWRELGRAEERPERLRPIDQRRRELALRLAERLTADVVRAELAQDGRIALVDAAGRSVVIKSGGLATEPGTGAGRGFALRPPPGQTDVEVTTVMEDGRTRLHRARRAWIYQPAQPEGSTATVLSVRLEEVRISGPGARELDPEAPRTPEGAAAGDEAAAGVRAEYVLTNLSPARDPLPGLLALPMPDLQKMVSERLKAVAAANLDDKPLADDANDLSRRIEQARREITARRHERIASVLACAVAVLLGAIRALRLRDSLPLPVYMWSCLPAGVVLMTIHGGMNLVSTQGWPGLLMLYGGVAALAGFAFVEFRRLARH